MPLADLCAQRFRYAVVSAKIAFGSRVGVQMTIPAGGAAVPRGVVISFLKITKPGQHNKWMSSPWISQEARQAQKDYLVQASLVLQIPSERTGKQFHSLSFIFDNSQLLCVG